MPTVRKMWYLKTTVTGKAKRLIRHIDLKEENYGSAWGILVDAYNNPRHVADTILNRLLQHHTNSDDPKSLKELFITTIESLASLKGLGIDVSSWDTILIAIIKQKLDFGNRALYEQSLEGSRQLQGLDTILSFLDQRIRVLDTLKRVQPSRKEQKGPASVCRGIPPTIHIDGTGLLSLESGCTARNSKISVSTFSTQLSETKSTYVRFGNITQINVEETSKPVKEATSKVADAELGELDVLQQQLAKLKDAKWENEVSAVQHHQIAAYVALAVLITLIIAVGRRHRRSNWKPRRRSSKPRTTSEQPTPEPTPRSFEFDISDG
ncbi:hypothetical protein KR054_004084 [Drosophila jambulina]|nr:hypothetical protein KR054_004084 [Drosophila jambulina]